jgi:hypothetical protein
MNNLQLFKKIAQNSKSLINSFDPIAAIKSNKSDNINLHKIQTTRRYTLGLFLERDIQLEIKKSEKLTSSLINNEIVVSGYQYNENKDELYLHKKVGPYYVIIQFGKVKPLKNEKMFDMMRNDLIEDFRKKIFRNSHSLYRIMGTENNPEYKKECKSFLIFSS